jgi:hypothetical protein
MQTSAATLQKREKQLATMGNLSALRLYVNPDRDETFLPSQQAWNELGRDDQEEVLSAFRDSASFDDQEFEDIPWFSGEGYWIPSKDRNPREADFYIVTVAFAGIATVLSIGTREAAWDGERWSNLEPGTVVTAWMRHPQPFNVSQTARRQ